MRFLGGEVVQRWHRWRVIKQTDTWPRVLPIGWYVSGAGILGWGCNEEEIVWERIK